MSSSVPVEGPRFSPVDSNHQGASLWIAAALSLTYFVLGCSLRVFLSYRQFSKDVVALVAATAFGFAQVMVVFSQLDSGFGTSFDLLSSSRVQNIQKDGYAADLLFILAVGLSKVSVVWFVARLTPSTKYLKLCAATALICAAWGIAGFFALALRCDLSHPWLTIGEKCTNLILRWKLIVAFDVITEVAILALIIGLVWDLQMAFEKKFMVVLGFTFRVPLIVLSIIHLHYIQSTLSFSNATFEQVIPSLVMQVQLGWSLISATIPCLKSFVVSLGSGYLGATLNTNLGSYASNRSWSRIGAEGSYVLNKIRVTRPQETEIVGGHADAASNRSANRVSNDGSQEFIIRRTVDYKIKYEDEGGRI